MIAQAWLQDADLGDAVAAMPWVVDGLSNEDFGLLLRLLDFAQSSNVQHTLLTTVFANRWTGDLKEHLLESLRHTAIQRPANFQEVVSLPWVVDGLNEEEAAFLVSLVTLASAYPGSSAYPELQANYFLQSEAVTLPLAGDVRVWVFQNTAFRQDEDLAGFIADSVGIMEELLGAPFPTQDVILLIVEDDSNYLARGFNYRHSMWITRAELDLPLVAHETAHYYYAGEPGWFSEGASDFLRSYVAHKRDSLGLEDWRKALLSGTKWRSCTSSRGIENLLHLSYWLPNGTDAACSYAMGEHFFLSLMETLGEQPLGAALSELDALQNRRDSVSEQQIYDTFLKHTPPESREAFLEVYDRLHGGPSLPGTPDDHGDDRRSATPLSFGEPVTGVLDYRFDLDFFSFQAEQGRTYRIHVRHDALGPSSLGLYSGESRTLARGVEELKDGLQMRWEAPSSGGYYVSVENFAGESGTYTLTVTQE